MSRCRRTLVLGTATAVLTAAFTAFGGEAAKTAGIQIVAGHFGKALDARHAAEAAAQDAYSRPPVTVECWARLRSKSDFNVLVACEPKESGTHWEIYSYAGTGVFSAYLPGYSPMEIKSQADITDDRWHYLAMLFDGTAVRLYVDGREVAGEPVTRNPAIVRQIGPLTFGTALAQTHQLQCDGLIDEVRISQGIRSVSAIPKEPLVGDKTVIGLWRFDEMSSTGELADASALRNPARVDVNAGRSMDEIDAASYAAGPTPMSSPAALVKLEPGAAEHPEGVPVLFLDGTWEMAEGGDESERLADSSWPDAIPAAVPGSIHTALQAAAKIPDPKFGLNDRIAHDASFRTYWLRRSFARPAAMEGTRWRLEFGGVAIRCTVWLNGEELGRHDGMFGGPEFDLGAGLSASNMLVVRIDPAPGKPEEWNNQAWRETVVFNNVYGWHYSSIPALGIWRPVKLSAEPAVSMQAPFVATANAKDGLVDLAVQLKGDKKAWAGKLAATIEPDNFEAQPWHFEFPARSEASEHHVHLQVRIPEPRLWWPNDLGEPNLYRMRLSFVPSGGGLPDTYTTTFGIRTIEMRPLPGGPRANRYNWTFVINSRPTFIKGTGWCTMDSSMDFSRERYTRFLTLAKLQHVQMLRAWGAGMPETDEFFDLCDRKGLLVLQEWPTAWNSHEVQPYELLEDTVRRNTLRLRNHPSLAMWGAGNESDKPVGKAIEMMGRLAIELDGTRPFHRAEPWGGSMHNYNCYWGRQPLDHNLNMIAPFFGEFGLACMPSLESVLRYLPKEERDLWPPPPDGSLAHHTPIFNTAEDVSRLMQYSGYFAPADGLDNFIFGSQLSQAVGVRHTLERARTRWPECTGALYYKMNDNYPAASWSCVDWYGTPKMSHYFFQDSFAPLHACALFTSVDSFGKPLSLPIYLLDDAEALSGQNRQVTVRAFDSRLKFLKSTRFDGEGPTSRVTRLGEFSLSAGETSSIPLLIVVELRTSSRLVDRTFYWINYQPVQGCLLKLPRTSLSLRVEGTTVTVTNTGPLPAVSVQITCPGHLDTFTADDNCFWLDPGESWQVGVNRTDGLRAEAWNAEDGAGQ